MITAIKSNSLIYTKSISGFVCLMSNLRYKKFLKFCQPMNGQPLSINSREDIALKHIVQVQLDIPHTELLDEK